MVEQSCGTKTIAIVTVERFKKIAKHLEPAEIAVYLGAKCIQSDGQRVTINRLKDILGKKAPAIIKKMKQKGLMPTGKTDIEFLEECIDSGLKMRQLSEITTVHNNPNRTPGVAILVDAMSRHLARHGATTDGVWARRQAGQARRLIADYDVTVDEWTRVISWATNDKYMWQHLVNIYQLTSYRNRYQLAIRAQSTSTGTRTSVLVDDLWKSVTL